jgi:hypothetical protein
MKRDTLIIIGVALAAIAIGVVIFLSGRGNIPNTSSAVANSQPSAAVAVPFTEITRGSKSTVTTRVNYFITSTDELNKLWKMIDATGTPPVIDFNTHTVLAVFAGKESTSSITVAKIEDTSTRMVSVAIAKPDSACAKKPPAISVYEIVAVPTTSLPLTHQDISTTATCPQ